MATDLKFDPNWTAKTELVGIRLELEAATHTEILPQYTTGLHAWFLDQVRQDDPDLSQYLHDEQSEKPFTLSGLEGIKKASGNKLLIIREQKYYWTITALSPTVTQWMKQWLPRRPHFLNLKGVTFSIQSVETIHPPRTYKELLHLPNSKNIALTFLSPTSFRRKGHHFPLPVPFNIFQSYLRRWNNFSGYEIETEPFLSWVDEHLLIFRHQLTSAKVAAGKKGTVTGFLGSIEYGLTPEGKKHSDYTQLLFALSQLAPYCGTGHKTPFGLGQTRLGWLAEPETIQTSTPEILLAQRIEQITEYLMQQQKRVGGERAFKTCQTRATILARQEYGESLIEIAQDLAMPYETVKTYAKLARKFLKGRV